MSRFLEAPKFVPAALEALQIPRFAGLRLLSLGLPQAQEASVIYSARCPG